MYIEKAVMAHPRTRAILARRRFARIVPIERFGEVFNAPGQNFRQQKHNPALILAGKQGRRVLPTPPEYHIGGRNNYYFSHMYNCVYDCRYCFLQGMYRSANHVVFVNFEDYLDDIEQTAAGHDAPSWYFSGYDCDSLALDPLTGFVDACLDRFARMPRACLELRTKSTQVRNLLSRTPLDNVVVAFSLAPAAIAASEEHRAPTLEKRLQALESLQQAGWQVGLRFDPVLLADNAETLYRELFASVFDRLDSGRIHSVSLGPFRLPRDFYRRMVKLYPLEKLLAQPFDTSGSMVSYPAAQEMPLLQFCEAEILRHIAPDRYFPCVSIT